MWRVRACLLEEIAAVSGSFSGVKLQSSCDASAVCECSVQSVRAARDRLFRMHYFYKISVVCEEQIRCQGSRGKSFLFVVPACTGSLSQIQCSEITGRALFLPSSWRPWGVLRCIFSQVSCSTKTCSSWCIQPDWLHHFRFGKAPAWRGEASVFDYGSWAVVAELGGGWFFGSGSFIPNNGRFRPV